MELSEIQRIASDAYKESDTDRKRGEVPALDDDSTVDVSGKNWEISPLLDLPGGPIEGLFMYKNVYNLIPRSVGGFGRLKTLKFFANEIQVLHPDAGGLAELECLQVKVGSPGLSCLPLQRLKALKELELCLVPPRPSAFSILNDVSSLKCLTKLSVCHFSIRYLPPEIGCLEKLEDLDLSFNKLKSLPNNIATLSALKSLKVANNKMIELPTGLSCLQKLVNLDFSNNRLTSLGSLKLESMPTLQNLNLQYNKLSTCQIPSWICCNLEGNGEDAWRDGSDCSLVEVDVFDLAVRRIDPTCSYNGSCSSSTALLSDTSSTSRSAASDRMRKRWKRRDYLQQRARQERLNCSRKWRSENHHETITEKMAVKCNPCKRSLVNRGSKLQCHLNEKKQSHSLSESSSLLEKTSVILKDVEGDSHDCESENDTQILLNHAEDEISGPLKEYGDDCSCILTDSLSLSECSCECNEDPSASSAISLNKINEQDEESPSETSNSVPRSEKHEESLSESSNSVPKFKRHSDRDLDSPKPRKCRRPVDDYSNISCKYSTQSLCGSNDHLPDGFYDAGRDRPFKPLQHYEQNRCLDTREVILVDRERDEDLDAIALTAQVLVSSFKQSRNSSEAMEQFPIDNFQRASLLALFVSDCFGGSDRSNSIVRMRKTVSGSNYAKPFVCTCATGNHFDNKTISKEYGNVETFTFQDLCEKSLRFIKESRNSNIVPIGTLRFGVCRHRAVLMKYLCDRADPPIPCELVRGYLDFVPHAWNTILVRRGNSLVRMVVDACQPTDIREETDPEYFCRYIPLTRVHFPVISDGFSVLECSFPSLPASYEVKNEAMSSITRCQFGNRLAAAKLRTLNASEATMEEIRTFEYNFIGEVRILGALRSHPCIVDIYGHQLSSKWVPPSEGNKEHRLLQSAIMMEYIEGGSLKSYMDNLVKSGVKHVPAKLALFIAKDIACALAEVHSRDIIHRDIKSENILIDLDSKREDGTPVVKLCDFDRAVPLQSYLHTCCIAHHGVHPPDFCVGTPRWMAPEVLKAMHRRHRYGLEVDIWSYGCVLFELLTLQVPHVGLSDAEFHHHLQMNRRPRLTDELETLALSNEPTMTGSDSSLEAASESDAELLKFLVNLFYQCTEGNPADRPTAAHIHDMLCSILPPPDSTS